MSTLPDEAFANGRCLCGAVSYTIHGKPIRMAQGHCRDCRRASGTGHMSLAFFKRDEVTGTSTRGIFARHAVVACMGKIERGPV